MRVCEAHRVHLVLLRPEEEQEAERRRHDGEGDDGDDRLAVSDVDDGRRRDVRLDLDVIARVARLDARVLVLSELVLHLFAWAAVVC